MVMCLAICESWPWHCSSAISQLCVWVSGLGKGSGENDGGKREPTTHAIPFQHHTLPAARRLGERRVLLGSPARSRTGARPRTGGGRGLAPRSAAAATTAAGGGRGGGQVGGGHCVYVRGWMGWCVGVWVGIHIHVYTHGTSAKNARTHATHPRRGHGPPRRRSARGAPPPPRCAPRAGPRSVLSFLKKCVCE